MKCKSLHPLSEFASKTKNIQTGNGQYASILFIIMVILDVCDHRFEVFHFKLHENLDLVLGIGNIIELEGIINSGELCSSFLNRSIPFFHRKRLY